MFSVLTSNVVDCGFEPRSDKTKDYKIGICCFFAKAKKKIYNNVCVFIVTCQKNLGSVGRDQFFILFFYYRQNRK